MAYGGDLRLIELIFVFFGVKARDLMVKHGARCVQSLDKADHCLIANRPEVIFVVNPGKSFVNVPLKVLGIACYIWS